MVHHFEKGKGRRLVGDTYEQFKEGDFVLIPPLMPHTWISEKKLTDRCEAIVIQFSTDFLAQLLQFPEMTGLNHLIAKADRGICFNSKKIQQFIPLLQLMVHDTPLTGFVSLIQVLQQLSALKSRPIASVQFKPMKGTENQQRINTIFRYVQQEFNETISLKKAASLIHLSESAFCKFFKRTSGKTFSDYTNEIRIAHACQLLIETDHPVSEVAFNSGFDSITYFNRVFLKKKGVRPMHYRRGMKYTK